MEMPIEFIGICSMVLQIAGPAKNVYVCKNAKLFFEHHFLNKKAAKSGRFLFYNLFSDKVFLTTANFVNYFNDISFSKTWCLNMTILLILLVHIMFEGNFV